MNVPFAAMLLLVGVAAAAAAAPPSSSSAAAGKQYAKVVCASRPVSTAADARLECVADSHRLVNTPAGEDSSGAVAWGSWSDDIATTGFGSLAVVSNASYTSLAQLYSAGYVEAAFTHTRIAQHFTNVLQMQLDGAPDDAYTRTLAFYEAQYAWATSMIAAHADEPRWVALNLTFTQLNGMVDGYMAMRDPDHEQPLALLDFLWSQSANDDFTEVLAAQYPAQATNCWDTTEERALSATRAASHCSALIKPVRRAGDGVYTDLLVAHNSWFDYRVQLRAMKSYHFALHDAPHTSPIGDYRVLFSSYPGYVWSQDDWYMLQSRPTTTTTGATGGATAVGHERSLLVMETTNNVCNASLLALVTSHSLFTWQRIVLSNMLARDGRDWTRWFAPHNSGTYNNQMMIVDFGRFRAGTDRDLPDGLLWIAEQMPGAVYAADVTQHLREHAYWASYNVPYFAATWVGLGYAKTAEVYGAEWTHDHCARANLFRRDHTSVVDVASMRVLERANHFQTDPLSHDNPFLAIAARGDLMPDNGGVPWVNRSAVGCIDAKVVDAQGMRDMQCDAVGGPTTDSQPPFDWTSSPLWSNHSHVGQPTVFDFEWATYHFTP